MCKSRYSILSIVTNGKEIEQVIWNQAEAEAEAFGCRHWGYCPHALFIRLHISPFRNVIWAIINCLHLNQ